MITITPKVFVINLKVLKDRWTRLLINSRAFNQDIERFEGVDGKSPDFKSIYKPSGITQCHEACCQSHRNLWLYILKLNLSYACILEDDAIVVKKIENIHAPDDFDILYLSNRINIGANFKAVNGCGTEGYIVSKKGIYKLLQICEDLSKPLDLRIQAHIRGFQEAGHNLCIASKEATFFSTLHPDIILEGYRTKDVYIHHDEKAISYIRT